MKKTLILTFQPTPAVLARAQNEFDVLAETEAMSPARVVELARKHNASAIMVTVGPPFTDSQIEDLPESLKIIATMSVGHDHLNIAALKKRGILVTNTPDVLTEATANQTFLLLLAASRRMKEQMVLSNKGWGRKLNPNELLGVDLQGKRLGIFGMGRIGQAVMQRAHSFGMEVIYCNRHRLSPELEKGARYFADFQEMLPNCQVLSLHAPGTSETESIMGASEFAKLPDGAIFINVARGTLVNEDALFEALRSKKLYAAGLDVCRNEPNPDSRFLEFSNVVLSPHVGSATQETRDAMGYRALDNIASVVRGESPKDLCK